MEKALDQHGRQDNFRSPKLIEPQSYDEAMGGKDWRKWSISVDKELTALAANGTWILCRRPPKGSNVITLK